MSYTASVTKAVLAAAAKMPKTSLPAAKLNAKADAKAMKAAKDKAASKQQPLSIPGFIAAQK